MLRGDHELHAELILVHKYLECVCIILLRSHPSSLCFFIFKILTPFFVVFFFIFFCPLSYTVCTSHVILAVLHVQRCYNPSVRRVGGSVRWLR
jgi:hypothetical protein